MSGNRNPIPKLKFQTRALPVNGRFVVEFLYPWALHLGWEYGVTLSTLEQVEECRRIWS